MASSLGRGLRAAILARAMTRLHGPVLFLLLLLLLGVVRAVAGAQANGLVEREAQARETVEALLAASLQAVGAGHAHPGLRGDFLARFPSLQPRPELGNEAISYADDGEYLYALAAASTATGQGFILRAWPLRFGHTGDVEFEGAEDGVLWEGMNCVGRSGTDVGFPPLFPDPDLDRATAGWTPLPAAHR